MSYLATGVVGVFSQFAVEALEENLVGDFAHVHTSLVQNGEDAFVLLLHQVHDDLVIEVIDLIEENKNIQAYKKYYQLVDKDVLICTSTTH